MAEKNYLDRNLRICYFSTDAQVVDVQRIALEKRLQGLGNTVDLEQIKGLEEVNEKRCDLLVVGATQVPLDDFPGWIERFSEKIAKQASVWVPALIISNASYSTLKSVLKKATAMNWYFDIVSQEHIDSLPIRFANLLRIHDHLHEMLRYEASINTLSEELEGLSSSLENLKRRPD